MIIISDLGGVILEKGFWKLWDYIETEHSIKSSKSRGVFLKYYKQVFSGKMEYSDFLDKFETDLGMSKGYDFWHTKLVEFFIPQKETLNIYKKLQREGHTLVLLSDQITELWVEINELHSISEYFDLVVISSETNFTKPDVRIYEYTLNECRGDPNNSIFIDDREENLEPAKKLGMKTILFENPNQLRKELNKILLNYHS